MCTVRNGKRRDLLAGNGTDHSDHTLSKGDFMTLLCPAGVLLQPEADGHRIFTGERRDHKRQREAGTLFGSNINIGQFLLLIQLSIPVQQSNAVEGTRRGEQVLIPDFEARVVDGNGDVLIAELDLLHLGRRSTITTVGNAVSAEIIVGRTLAEVAAVGLEPLAVAVFFQMDWSM